MSSGGGGGGVASETLPSNPASALVASSRPPIPLAPRLTTTSTSQQVHHIPSTLQAAADNTQTSSRSPRLPRPLIHRASLSAATQALNVDTSPPSARFSAYNIPRPSRPRLQGSLQRSTPELTGIGTRRSVGSFAFGLDDSSAVPSRHRAAADQENEAADDHFEVLPQFKKDADFPGNVMVRCIGSDFYVHRAVLYFASPFFQAVLDGDWKETHPSLHTLSDSDEEENGGTSAEEDALATVSGAALSVGEEDPSIHRNASSPRASFYTADFSLEGQDTSPKLGSLSSVDFTSESNAEEDIGAGDRPVTARPRGEDQNCGGDKREVTGRLKGMATPPLHERQTDSSSDVSVRLSNETSTRRGNSRRAQREKRKIIAIIDLSEEDASTFQDFLCLIYPNLDLLVTWYNIFPLFSFSDKFEVPHLRRACVTFLRAALAGRPIEAMALGERHGLEDVYREASRHVLENMPSWETEELEILSSETLLKLERKRTWFLERLLKLGLANPARDYECHTACPDPQNCARLLHERWRSQYANAFKFGPPQPSIIWRHLRELEGSASLVTAPAMSACQSSSKAWVQLLFDRMYGLPTHGMTHPKFLSIKLDSDHAPAPKVKRRPTEGDMSLPS